MLSQLGDEAKLLAGGQSLIPLMKLRLSAPRHLVDLNFIPGTSYIRSNGVLRLGAMTRHAEIAASKTPHEFPFCTTAPPELPTSRCATWEPLADRSPKPIPPATGLPY